MSQIAVASGRRATPAEHRAPCLGLVEAAAGAEPGEGIVWRTALVNRLRARRSAPLVTLVAPGGYGKTTVLEQWAARDDRHFVWLTADSARHDPATLLAQIDAAVATGRDTTERAARTGPVVAVFDDAHLLGADARAGVAELLRLAGDGALIVLSGRFEPRIPDVSIPRLRARGGVLELDRRDLAFTRREVSSVLRTRGRPLTDAALAELVDETEGWPAAVQLAAGTSSYRSLESRCLAALTPDQRAFLRRTSVLERLSRPLCDAVLGCASGTREPESMDELATFLVPLDRTHTWFRYHRLLRERLRRELEATEPELVPVLHRRAAAWHESRGDPGSALEHAHAAQDVDRCMALFAAAALAAHNRGEGSLDEWLGYVDGADGLERYPEAAALAARLHAHHGRAREAARCLGAADRGLAAATRSRAQTAISSRARLVHAATAAKRPRQMLSGAEAALRELPTADHWRPYGLFLQGVANVLLGDEQRADVDLRRAVDAAERVGATETLALALTERALLADARGDHVAAEACLTAARSAGDRLERLPSYALTLAVSARAALRHGRWDEARLTLAAAQRLLPGLTEALPWLAVQTRLELAAAHVMLRDTAAARLLLAAADELLGERPCLGTLTTQRGRLEIELATMPADETGRAVRLTGAELKLLPLLATHLSFREIGSHFYLSRHTVKTQAISAYRKLGASSRSEAVERAGQLGLIETA
jgi:LuxR family maltose regulon positive regulatory protein